MPGASTFELEAGYPAKTSQSLPLSKTCEVHTGEMLRWQSGESLHSPSAQEGLAQAQPRPTHRYAQCQRGRVHKITTKRSGDEQDYCKGGSVPTAKDPSPKGTFDRSGGTPMKNG